MKLRLQLLLLSFACFFSANSFAQYIQITDNIPAQDLVENYLVNSSCAVVSNFSVTGGSFGVQQSFGIFSGTGTAFPFLSGIVLSTGKAVSATGPNDSLLSEGATSWSGDSDLEQALGISSSINATVLEFDFVPLTNKISFDYIFSSEQYLTSPSSNQCNFTDGFAFLLREATSSGAYQNLALVPGTTIPVKVNTVRGSGAICPAANEAYFDAFNTSNHPTNFNGQTIPMKASADVVPGTLYHIKLVIADQGNNLYDSAIFLKSGSFKSITDLGQDRLTTNNNPYCSGEMVTLDATLSGTNNYRWLKDGVEVANGSNPTYSITDNTNPNVITYSVEVTLGTTTCVSEGEIKIQFASLPILVNSTLVQCDDNADGISVFNLTKLDNLIRNNDTTLRNVVYYESLTGSAISNPTSYQNTTANTQTIYAKVANAFLCTSTAIVTLQIANNPIPTPNDLEVCDQDGTFDGKADFILTIQLTGIPLGLVVEYYLSETNAINQQNVLVSPYKNTMSNNQTIYARIVNGPDCYGITPINLVVNTFNPSGFEDETKTLCNGNSIKLNVSNTFLTYNWLGNNDFDSELEVDTAGEYTIEVTNVKNCSAKKKFIVVESAAATNIDAVTEDFTGQNNSLIITYTDNGGDYEFSIDGINYQENPSFTNLSSDEYTIYVKDKNGCLPTPSKKVYVLDYPKFFTPNGDGINDTWEIKNIQTKGKSTFTIFDRFGKLLKQFDSNSAGWDGRYNGQNLPSGDYWFTLTLFNSNVVRNHFSLKR
ncbi:choice-of-anchor L domain-containing protein [Flavobacterium sp.]|uniref:choice-of-anchor L domain-containing protein n=1 Tax=Flavobacterium sp. TaxID=239 RepID=UPI00286E51E7|nr:choice-of-anchor L domain-containing protein [Flavobacterium sp.]